LSRYGFISLGFSKKILWGLRALGIEDCIKKLADEALFAFGQTLDLLKLPKELLCRPRLLRSLVGSADKILKGTEKGQSKYC
jgi:hypothetical protein